MEEGRTEASRNDRVKAGGKVVKSGRKVQTNVEDQDEDRSVPKYVARYAPYTLGFYGYIPADAPVPTFPPLSSAFFASTADHLTFYS
jgi:hypothetical protein